MKSKIPVFSISQFRDQLTMLMDVVRHQPIVISYYGKRAAVVLSHKEYQRLIANSQQ